MEKKIKKSTWETIFKCLQIKLKKYTILCNPGFTLCQKKAASSISVLHICNTVTIHSFIYHSSFIMFTFKILILT